jgi:hypothetical protein
MGRNAPQGSSGATPLRCERKRRRGVHGRDVRFGHRTTTLLCLQHRNPVTLALEHLRMTTRRASTRKRSAPDGWLEMSVHPSRATRVDYWKQTLPAYDELELPYSISRFKSQPAGVLC